MSWNDTRRMYGSFTAKLDADSNGGTDIELVAAAGAGKAIVVDHITVSGSAASSWFLESGASTVIFPTIYMAANTSYSIDEPNIRTAANAALNFTATITGNISVFIKYHIEG